MSLLFLGEEHEEIRDLKIKSKRAVFSVLGSSERHCRNSRGSSNQCYQGAWRKVGPFRVGGRQRMAKEGQHSSGVGIG